MTSQASDPNNSRHQPARGQGRSPEHPIIALGETKMQREQEILEQKYRTLNPASYRLLHGVLR